MNYNQSTNKTIKKKGGTTTAMKTLISTIIIITAAIITASCAHQPQPKIIIPPPTITFPTDYAGQINLGEPKTWSQYYDRATSMYTAGKYNSSKQLYLEAAQKSMEETRKTCLAAAATASLAAEDRQTFKAVMQTIKQEFPENPLKFPTTTDDAIKELQKIKQ
jgi:hypothetical protein